MTEIEAIEALKNMYPLTCEMVDGRLKGGFKDHDCQEGMAIDMAISALEKQSQIVHCKNCIHWGAEVPGETECVKCCEYGGYMVGENGFCCYGEREKRIYV